MADVFTVTAKGLRDINGRFTTVANQQAATRRDEMLTRLAKDAADRLKETAPKRTGHFASMFAVSSVSGNGPTASVTVTNADTVRSKAGRSYSLAQLLMTGTKPHDIPGAFGYSLPFGTKGRFSGLFHPGTKANDFVTRALEDLDVTTEGQRAAISVAHDLVGA